MAELWLRKFKGDGSTVYMVYKIKVFDSFDVKLLSPISPMPLPEEGGEENVLVKMEGNTHTYRISWLMTDDSINSGVSALDSSNVVIGGATEASTKTIFEKLKWFKGGFSGKGFVGESMDEKYELLIFDNFLAGNGSTLTQHDMSTGSVQKTGIIDFQSPTGSNVSAQDWAGLVFKSQGFIRDFNFRTTAGEPATLRATVEFIEGNLVGSYQSKTPSEVGNFRIDDHASQPHQFVTITCSLPIEQGSSNVTHFDVGFKISNKDDDGNDQSGSGGDYIDSATPNNATTIHFGGSGVLAPDTRYDFRIRAVNGEGEGKFTEGVSHTTAEAP